MKRIIKILLIIIIAFVLIVGVGYFLFLPNFLNKKLCSSITDFNEKTSWKITINDIKISQNTKICLSTISITKKEYDEKLIEIDTIDFEISIFDYFIHDKLFSDININKVILYAHNLKPNKNINNDVEDIPKSNIGVNIKNYGRFVPSKIMVDSLLLKYYNTKDSVELVLTQISKNENDFNSNVFWKEIDYIPVAHLKGQKNGDEVWQFKFLRSMSDSLERPYLSNYNNIFYNFDSVKFEFDIDWREMSWCNSVFQIFNSKIYHPRLSADTVGVPYLFADLNLIYKNKTLTVDSGSVVQIQNFRLFPYLAVSRKDDVDIDFRFWVNNSLAQDFIDCLPNELFSNLNGLELGGYFDSNFALKINPKKPDSLNIFFQIIPNGLEIKNLEKSKLNKMNAEFQHRVYEDTLLIKEIFVSQNSAHYVKLDSISPFLKYAILNSEDGLFFRHKGFIEEAIRFALIENIKAKRFVRGGSTISMQLVKNVYLNRTKNAIRKFEEAIIVWLIENLKLVSKERMFEIYLNIIEWGPNVYGVKAASEFYFSKQAWELNLAESIFMASVIPRPKKFYYLFYRDGGLRDYYKQYNYNIINNMLISNQITEQDTIGFTPVESLTGKALLYVKPKSKVSLQKLEQEIP